MSGLAVRQNGGMQIQSFEDMIKWADTVRKSGLAPSSFTLDSQIVVATQYGMELGMSPMVALQSICVVNGKVTVWEAEDNCCEYSECRLTLSTLLSC